MRKIKAAALLLAFVMLFGFAAPTHAQARTEAELTSESTEAAEVEYYGRAALATLDNAEALLFAYDSIVSGVESCAESITLYDGVNALSEEELSTVLDAYRRDRTEHFWFGRSYSYSYTSSTVVSLKPSYTMAGEELAAARVKFESAVKATVALTDGVESEFEKELILHDELARRVSYVTDAPHAHDSYGAIVDGEAVCEGYAEAFQYLLRRAGIQSFIITGASANPGTGASEGHAWNAVRIDGKYYHADLTWDDQGATVYHAYFNLTDVAISEDHVIDTTAYPLPVCNSDDANYFKVKGGIQSVCDAEQIGREMKENAFRVHVYVSGDVGEFTEQYYASIREIAAAANIGGSFTYGYSRIGRELVLYIKPSAAFSGVSLSVGTDLALRYYVQADDAALNAGTLAVRFTFNGKSVLKTDYTVSDGRYVFTLDGIGFHQMCDTVEAELLLIGGGQSSILCSKEEYSVDKYLGELLLRYSDSDSVTRVASDLIVLGRAAQGFLDYRTDAVAAQGAKLTPSTSEPSERDAGELSDTGTGKCSFGAPRVEFNGTVSLVLYIFSDGGADGFELRIGGDAVPASELTALGDGRYRYALTLSVLEIDNFVFAELGGDESAARMKYSASSYVYDVTVCGAEGELSGELLLAIYRLGQSADAYEFSVGRGA